MRSYLLVLLILAAGWTAPGQDTPMVYYVSPAGTAAGDGSLEQPMDLATALGARSRARPGDTILLRGGTYSGNFNSTLAGADGRPITVRAMTGQRATIDGQLYVRGSWTWYWGLEITNSNPDRVKERPEGLMVLGPNTKLINLVVHDTGTAVGFWTPAVDAEVYGCLIYRNGWEGPAPDRGHGHGIYAQNETGTKRLADNIIFDQYGYGIHAYGEQGQLKGFNIEGNIIMDNGSPTRSPYRSVNILVGGLQPAERTTVVRNVSYNSPGKGGANVFGYGPADNKDLVVRDNYFIGGNPALILRGWESGTITGNTFYEKLSYMFTVELPKKSSQYSYTIDSNTYWQGENANPFGYHTQIYNFNNWRRNFGFDSNGRWLPSETKKPSGVQVFVRPNQYEPGRAHIAVLNWDLKDTVEVDLRGALATGTSYEVREVHDYYGAPVATGIYTGAPVTLPLRGAGTAPEFTAFVLLPGPRTLPPRLRRAPAAP